MLVVASKISRPSARCLLGFGVWQPGWVGVSTNPDPTFDIGQVCSAGVSLYTHAKGKLTIRSLISYLQPPPPKWLIALGFRLIPPKNVLSKVTKGSTQLTQGHDQPPELCSSSCGCTRHVTNRNSADAADSARLGGSLIQKLSRTESCVCVFAVECSVPECLGEAT